MMTEVASVRKNSSETSGSSDAVTKATEGAENFPAAVMEMVEEATNLLSELPVELKLDVVGAVVSARIEVILLHPRPWQLTLAIQEPVQRYNVFLKSFFIRLATDDEICLLRRLHLRIP